MSKYVLKILIAAIVDFIMVDTRSRIELAFSWLYEEYVSFMGFCLPSSSIKEENRQAAVNSYSAVFCSLVERLKKQPELKERDL